MKPGLTRRRPHEFSDSSSSKGGTMKSKIRSALLAVALSAGSTVGMVAAPSAQAGTCTRTVGAVMEVVTTANYDLGTFYQGYDFCQKRAYAEFHFKDRWVSQVASSSSQVWIVSGASGDPGMHHYNPAGIEWWDAGEPEHLQHKQRGLPGRLLPDLERQRLPGVQRLVLRQRNPARLRRRRPQLQEDRHRRDPVTPPPPPLRPPSTRGPAWRRRAYANVPVDQLSGGGEPDAVWPLATAL